MSDDLREQNGSRLLFHEFTESTVVSVVEMPVLQQPQREQA